MDRRTLVARLAATAVGAPALAALGPAGSRLSTRPPLADGPSDDEINRWIRLATVPSLAMATVARGRVTTRAFGVRRAGEAERATADTVYSAASLTKLVTAYVVLDLVLDGRLALDRPVADVLSLPETADDRSRSITIRHLLSHSGGWPNWRFEANDKLASAFEPGTQWRYSGEGYVFLQRMAEKVTQQGFGRLVRDRVLAPLGMRHSSMVGREDLTPRLASAHGSRGEVGRWYGDKLFAEMTRLTTARGVTLEDATWEEAEAAFRALAPKAAPLPNNLVPNAAASLRTTAADFGALLLHLVTAREHGGRPAEIVTLITTRTIACNDEVAWGLGAGLELVRNRWRSWQWGDNSGFKNFYTFDAAAGTACVVFTNGDSGAHVWERVIRATDRVDHPAFLFG